MTKTKTVTEATVHGEIEYEVVECASCEMEYRPENTETFYTGTVREVSNWNSFDTVKFSGNSMTKVHFCENCTETPTGVKIPFNIPYTVDQILMGSLVMLVIGFVLRATLSPFL